MDSNIGPRVIIVDDTDWAINYSEGQWAQRGDGSVQSAYLQTLQSTQTNGSFSYVFEGTAVSVVGAAEFNPLQNPELFTWTCAVDGKPITVPENVVVVLCSGKDLADARHLLTVNVTSWGSSFWLDSIQYVPSKISAPPLEAATLIDDSDADFEYDRGWRASAKSVYHTKSTNIVGSSVSFNFTGRGISWVAVLSTENAPGSSFLPSTGIYVVDDEDPVFFNFAAIVPPNDPANQVLFQTGELKPGKHTLKVTYIGNLTFQSQPFLPSRLEPVDLSLDYLLATAPFSVPTLIQPSQSLPKPTGLGTQLGHDGNKLGAATLGGIIGGVVSLCLLLGIGFVLWRRKLRRYRTDLASEAFMAPSMYDDIPYEVEPFPVPSAIREAPPLDKWDHITGKLLARESASRTDQSGSFNNATSSSNTNNSPTPSADIPSGPINDALQLVRHEDSGIRLRRDVVEVPPGYTEN